MVIYFTAQVTNHLEKKKIHLYLHYLQQMNSRELEEVNKWNPHDLEENMNKFIYNLRMGKAF